MEWRRMGCRLSKIKSNRTYIVVFDFFLMKKRCVQEWIGILENKGVFYFVLMGILAFLCIYGIVIFCKNIKNNYWWRWIYIFGGGYLLFDLFAIAIEWKIWNDLLLFMFDVNSSYWNIVWGFFILLGAFVFCLGVKLLKQRRVRI